MISEELKKIKSFGSSMESSVTPEDIVDKEKELGVMLPQALRDFYFTFQKEQKRANFVRNCANFVPENKIQKYIKKIRISVAF